MIANKLKPGDEIRVVAPSRSQAIIWEHVHHHAVDFWMNSGYKLTFSKNCRELDKYQSSSIASRLSLSSIYEKPIYADNINIINKIIKTLFLRIKKSPSSEYTLSIFKKR